MHPSTFRHCERPFVKIRWDLVEAARQNRPPTPKQARRRERRALRKEARNERRARRLGLVKLGYERDPAKSVRRRVESRRAAAAGASLAPRQPDKSGNLGQV